VKKILLFLPLIVFYLGVISPVRANSKPRLSFDQSDFLLFSSGKKIEETLNLRNSTDKLVKVSLSWVPYSKMNLKLEKDFAKKHSVDFATISETTFNLEPYEVKPIKISFNTPSELKSGDYYGQVKAIGGESIAESNFTLRILGNLIEKVDGSAAFAKDFFTVEVSNLGNRTTKYKISAEIKGLFGNTNKDFRFNNQNLKAGQIQVLQSKKLKLLPGYYQAKVSLVYSENNLEKNLIVNFWVRPEIFIVSVITLLISTLGFAYLRFNLRKI